MNLWGVVGGGGPQGVVLDGQGLYTNIINGCGTGAGGSVIFLFFVSSRQSVLF